MFFNKKWIFHGFNFLTNDSGTNPLVIISFRKEIMFWVCHLPTLWQIVINFAFFFSEGFPKWKAADMYRMSKKRIWFVKRISEKITTQMLERSWLKGWIVLKRGFKYRSHTLSWILWKFLSYETYVFVSSGLFEINLSANLVYCLHITNNFHSPCIKNQIILLLLNSSWHIKY